MSSKKLPSKKLFAKKFSSRKLILIEDQKRLQKNKIVYYLKKRVLPKIKRMQILHHFSYPKIVRQIRMPANKPKFRF